MARPHKVPRFVETLAWSRPLAGELVWAKTESDGVLAGTVGWLSEASPHKVWVWLNTNGGLALYLVDRRLAWRRRA